MKKIYMYISSIVIFLLVIIIGTLLDKWQNLSNVYSLIFKLIIIIICKTWIKRNRVKYKEGKFFTKYLFVALIPMCISIILICGPINRAPSLKNVVLGILGMLATAIWEELFYRVIGVEVFKNSDGIITKNSVIILVLLFSFSHAINIVLKPHEYMIELFRIVLSASAGMLFLALYLKTRNIYVPILSHFLMNYTTLFFKTFSYTPNVLGYITYDIVFYVGIIAYFLLANRIFKKNKLLK